MLEHADFVEHVVPAVRRVIAGYPVEQDDALQEVWAEFYDPDFQARLCALDEDGDRRVRYVVGMARNVAGQHGRREAAHLYGFEVRDQFIYGPEQVKDMLPAAVSYTLSGELPTLENGEERVSGGSGPTDGRGVLVGLTDLLVGLAELREKDRRAVVAYYGMELSDDVLRDWFGIEPDSVRRVANRALKRLVGNMNGELRRQHAEHEGPGSRRSVPNTLAVVMTEDGQVGSLGLPHGEALRPKRFLRRVPAHLQQEI